MRTDWKNLSSCAAAKRCWTIEAKELNMTCWTRLICCAATAAAACAAAADDDVFWMSKIRRDHPRMFFNRDT